MATAELDLTGELGRVGVFSRGMLRLRGLREFLRAGELVFRPTPSDAARLSAIVGWGHKPTAREAREFAERHELPYLRVEDGFLRSVKPGQNEAPLSLVVDELGIYYDARGPSRLEKLLLNGDPLEDLALLSRARRCRKRIVQAGLSKYNDTEVAPPKWLRELEQPFVLVVDQTYGDAAVDQGLSSRESFAAMLKAALDEHPGATVFVKTHPEVLSGKKRGYLTHGLTHPRVRIVTQAITPAELIVRARHVYVCTSQLGFEALLAEKPVTCFGVPFYAGWGLTDDRVPIARRGRARSIDELAAAALILYPRYLDPIRLEPCEVEQVIEHLAYQREMFEKNQGRHFCFGFSFWKRPFVRRYLASPGNEVHFVRSTRSAVRRGLDSSARVLVWGERHPKGLREFCNQHGVPLARMEDGFLRSVRLGSDLSAPSSLVLDEQGIYYDATKPSGLELLLEEAEFTERELEQARSLRAAIVEARVSKYNLGDAERPPVSPRAGQRVLLVVGQVEDDASIRLGAVGIRDNKTLLETVRRENPDEYVVFKPHPDVVAGNRRGKVPNALALCDLLVEHTSIAACLDAAQEVHTISSLTGFEALLRGLRVVTYGQPFYAGFGLTVDREPISRRTRKRTLDELVAASLLRYPRYYSYEVKAFVKAEGIVHELARARSLAGDTRSSFFVRRLRSLVLLAKELADVD
jgi:capsular polysaccharide export protein